MLCIGYFLTIGCAKKEREPEEDNSEQLEKKERATYNNKQMPGVGNVYVSGGTQAGGKQELYAKADYQSGHLAYYISPTATDLGADHRIVFGANKGDLCVVEVDEAKQVLRMYTEREGKRLPVMLKVSQYSLKQFEFQLYRIDWDKKVEELVTSVYLRDGKPVGTYKLAARATSALADTVAKDTVGFPGVKRPAKQSSVTANTAVMLDYVNRILGPLVDLSNEGMATLSGKLEQSSATAAAFGALWYDLGVMNTVLAQAGMLFGSFRTDPLAKDDPMSSFSWYMGQGHTAVNLKNMQLTPVLKNSALLYDETDLATQLKLTVQVEDKNKKALIGNPVFVDFRVELEQEGKIHVLSEQTLSSDKEKGTVELLYNPHQAAVKPKVGSKLNILYRLSAHEGAVFAKQEASIADREPARISIVSGAGQEADWEEKLKAPLIVKVTNRAGQGLKNISISWTVQSVSWGIIVGTLSDTQVVTDDQGFAKTYYRVGKQQEKPETVKVQVVGSNGQPIPKVETIFTYKQKRRNFTLVQMKPEKDTYYGSSSTMREWKSGDAITIMENEMIQFNIKEDGKLLKRQDGSIVEFGLGTNDIIRKWQYGTKTFQSKDIVLKNWAVIFSDPISGRTDSIVIDLTISNQLYRTFVGKTLRAEGGGSTVDGNRDEVLTFAYRADGKVEMKSAKYPTTNVLTTYETHLTYSYVPIYGCSDKNGVIPYTMKRALGTISSPAGPSMIYGMSSSFLLFEDGTIRPLSMGTGFDACTFNRFWSSVKLQ